VALATALHFPNADEWASLDPVAVVFATPWSSEVASPSLPLDELLVEWPPVSDVASEKLPPVATALDLPPVDTSASAKLLAPVAFDFAVLDPSELAKHSLPSEPLLSTLAAIFSLHTAPAPACACAAAKAKSAAAANPIIAFPRTIDLSSPKFICASSSFEMREYSCAARRRQLKRMTRSAATFVIERERARGLEICDRRNE
jgi:hypothetical protein